MKDAATRCVLRPVDASECGSLQRSPRSPSWICDGKKEEWNGLGGNGTEGEGQEKLEFRGDLTEGNGEEE